MNFKQFVIIANFIFFSSAISAQQNLNHQNSVPSSPEVANIGKFTDIPVGYFSGTPQIGIPFVTAKSGSVEIPITLSYNASGIRVEETPSWVGLGWGLSTGPTLSRVVKGLPDESGFGYKNCPPQYRVKHIDALPRVENFDAERWNFEVNVYPQGNIDLEPDIYHFSAFGYSGKFFWNQDSAKYIFSPLQNIVLSSANGWTLTLPNGIICRFNAPQNEIMYYRTTSTYSNGYSMAPSNDPFANYATSWPISEIVDPTGRAVSFTYTSETSVEEFGRAGETMIFESGFGNQLINIVSNSVQYFTKPILTKISADNYDVIFKRNSSVRQDVWNSGRSLDTISVLNKSSAEVKSFLLKYSYTTSSDNTVLYGLEKYAPVAKKRLILQKVQEWNFTAFDSFPGYYFTYNNTPLPNRLSSSQDYWGYYNGKANGINLMPQIPKQRFNPVTQTFIDTLPTAYIFYGGANRRIDTNFTQAGILTQIKYPTGGTTKYYYEPNRVPRWHFAPEAAGAELPDQVDKLFTFMPLLNANAPYPRDYSTTFTITRPATQVLVTPNLPAPCELYNNNALCLYTIKITNLTTSTVVTTFSITVPFWVYLTQGEYLVECHVNGSTDDYVNNFTVQFKWGEAPEQYNMLAGGVRVSSIVSEDGLGGKIQRGFTYNNTEGNLNESSGFLGGFPFHIKKIDRYLISQGNAVYISYTSNGVIPLTTDGKTVKYTMVTEYFDSARSSFKNEYKFSHDLTMMKFARNDGSVPFTKEWQDGHLIGKISYEKTGGIYRKLIEESTLYQPNKMVTELYGLAGQFLRPYEMATEWFVPVSNTSTQYSYANGSNTSLTTNTSSTYNSKYLLSSTINTNSQGKILNSKTWYPFDYNDVSGYNINTLISKNIISIPIKEEVSINGKIVSGSVFKYSSDGLPLSLYNYENSNLADTTVHNRNLILPSNYVSKTNINYDANRNLKHLSNNNSPEQVYIWSNEINSSTGKNVDFAPVAIIKNADSLSVAYTSFEAATKGNWTYSGSQTADVTSPTGTKCYNLSSGSMTKGLLNASIKYIVSYWSKNGSYVVSGNLLVKQGRSVGGWTFFEHEISGVTTTTISGTGSIDEVRLYPRAAFMNTYTFKYSVGTTSHCDENNKITYYEYDSHSRLILIRDQDKNIVQKICYNYAGQFQNCGMGTEEQWQVVDSYCQAPVGTNSNLIRIEKNINPSSSTYGNTRTITIPNAAECPVCNTTTCTGQDKKCINGVCETGVEVCTGNFRVSGVFYHYYHYVWSDSSTSPTYSAIGSCFF